MENLASNLIRAARSLGRQPGFILSVILTLALGIGVNAAIFSVFNTVILRPLPYADPDELVVIWEKNDAQRTTREWSSIPDFFDWAEQNRAFSDLAGYRNWEGSLVDRDRPPLYVKGARVSHNFFPMLGIQLAAGRSFSPEEDRPGGRPVAIVSHDFWQGSLNGAGNVIGRPVTIDGLSHTIVGVLPRGFLSPASESESVWLPLQGNPAAEDRRVHNLVVVGRLADGVSLKRAQLDMSTIMLRLEKQFAESNAGRGAFVESLREVLVGSIRLPLLLLLSSVSLVLLIACVNVANLFLVRALSRQREGAVRSALGAGKYHLLQPFLLEVLLLALLGAGLGLFLAHAGLQLLRAADPGILPRLQDVRIDGAVFGFTLLAALFAIGVTLVLSARRITRSDLQVLLKEGAPSSGGAGRQRMRRALVVFEVALSVMLVIGAGLLIKSYYRTSRVDLGFKPEGLIALDLVLPEARYPFPDFEKAYPRWPEVVPFYNGVLERVGALPGVKQVSVAANHPLSPGFPTEVTIEGHEDASARPPRVRLRPVSPGYFQVVGLPLLKGRALSPRDGVEAPTVVIVNQAFARRFYGGVDAALGKRITFWGRSREIVGIVLDERFLGLQGPIQEAMYPPFLQCPLPNVSIVTRAANPQAVRTQDLQKVIWSLDRDLAINSVRPMAELLDEQLARPRFDMSLFLTFAVLAMILAMVGVYGVMAQVVAQRSSEVAIRMALGSRRSGIYYLMIKEGTKLVLFGLVVGIALALPFVSLISRLLFEVNARDPMIFLGAALTLLLAGVAACLLPTLRAMRIEPGVALRAL